MDTFQSTFTSKIQLVRDDLTVLNKRAAEFQKRVLDLVEKNSTRIEEFLFVSQPPLVSPQGANGPPPPGTGHRKRHSMIDMRNLGGSGPLLGIGMMSQAMRTASVPGV